MPATILEDAPTQPNTARGDFVVRRGTFFQIGEYPDKQFGLTEQEADAAIAQFTPVPLNVEHIPTIFDGRLGVVQKLWREGKSLLAEYAIPRWLHDVTQGEAIKISSEWNRASKRPIGGAFVLHPRVADAVMQAAFREERWARERAGKEWELMSLLSGLKALFQRAGVSAEEIDAQLTGVGMPAEPPAASGESAVLAPAETGAEDAHARFAEMEAELARLRQEAHAAAAAARFASDAQLIEDWIRTFHITPAEAEAWRTIARDAPAAFASVLPAMNTRARLPQLTGSTVRASQTADADRLEALTQQKMKTEGLDHTAAFKEVCAENRDLALSVRLKSQEGN